MNIFTLSYLKEFFERNKTLLLISLGIFIASLIVGAIYGYFMVGGKTGLLSTIISSAPNKAVNPNCDPVELFIHNFTADILIILGGLVLSIFSVFSAILNGFSIGTSLGMDVPFFVVGIIPHGIVEYAATIFSLAGAFILTKLEIIVFKAFINKNQSVKEVLKDNKVKITDIILIIIIDIVLLAIAAIIEGFITGRLLLAAF